MFQKLLAGWLANQVKKNRPQVEKIARDFLVDLGQDTVDDWLADLYARMDRRTMDMVADRIDPVSAAFHVGDPQAAAKATAAVLDVFRAPEPPKRKQKALRGEG